MTQPHLGDGGRGPERLKNINLGRLPGRDVAEAARPRAAVPQDHQGGRTLAPTLENVGTPGFLAYRVQVHASHQLLEVGVLGAHVGPHLHPFGTLRFAGQQTPLGRRRPFRRGVKGAFLHEAVDFKSTRSSLPSHKGTKLHVCA